MKKSVISFILALLMLSTALISCGKTPPAQTDSTDSTSARTPEETTEPVSEETTIPELPEMDFEGEDYVILYSARPDEARFNDFTADEAAATVLDEAVFKRNERINEKYNVSVSTVEDIQASPAAYGMIVQNHRSGDDAYDAAALLAYDVSKLAYDDYLADINSLEYVDLENPWWDQNATRDLQIGGSMYYTTGNFAIYTKRFTFCTLFNKTIAAEKTTNDYYQLVNDGKWTIDVLMNDARLVSEDLDANDVIEYTDIYGLHCWNDTIYGILNATGEKCCTIDKNGEIVLTMGTERVYAAIEKYVNFTLESEYVINYQKTPTPDDYYAFRDGHALFSLEMMKQCEFNRDSETEYGVLPYPKFDSEQDGYHCAVGPWHVNMIAIPSISEDTEFSAFVLEALCRESDEIIVDAYYEKALKGSGVRDEESVGMLDVIFDSTVYDIGYFYAPGNISKTLITEVIQYNNPNFASIFASYETAANYQIKMINDKFAKITN